MKDILGNERHSQEDSWSTASELTATIDDMFSDDTLAGQASVLNGSMYNDQDQDDRGYGNFVELEANENDRQMVVYHPPSSFPESVDRWLHSVDALVRSDEMTTLVVSTRDIVFSAGSLAVKTALLPVTLPLHIACTTTDMVVGGCAHVIGSTGALVGRVLMGDHHHETRALQSEEPQQDKAESAGSLLGSVFGLPGMALGLAGKITADVGSAVIGVAAAPVLMLTQSGEPRERKVVDAPPATVRKEDIIRSKKCVIDASYSETDNFLDRLRLDYEVASESPLIDPAPPSMSSSSSTNPTEGTVNDPGSVSKFLLRVDDLDLKRRDPNDSSKIIGPFCYIDLDCKDEVALREYALSMLVARGVSMLSNHPTVRLGKHYRVNPKAMIEWKPEGSTLKLLRKMVKMTTLERLRSLERDVLIWSGKFAAKDCVGNNNYPFFLARGVVQRSPRDFMKLLWDNERTTEYNNFCLGRSNLLVVEDKILAGASVGTKVVKSETRVPFTSLSVMVVCVMHVRPLEAPDEGYVIVSRSLDCGSAGYHLTPDDVEKGQKNEIIWGINVLRRVPNHPHLTDLTSFSQVGSNLVPKFLAGRIGLMGIEDFFKNVREPKSVKQPTRSSSSIF